MNKIYLLTAAFAVMASLSGCSDTELASIDTVQEKTPIGFHTVGSQMESRATIINNGEDLKSTTFNVYAFNRKDDGTDDAVFMGTNDEEHGHSGVNISYQDGKWNYTSSADLKYWPTSALNFYAVSPVSDHNIFSWQISQKKKEISVFTSDEYDEYDEHGLPKDNPDNIDVMYAISKNQTKSLHGGTVHMQFRHVLSQVAFNARTQTANMKVIIEGVKICNVNFSGTFTLPPTEDADPTQDNWTLSALPLSNFTAVKGKSIDIGNTDKEVSIDGPMLFIPQKLTKWATTAASPKTTDQADNDKQSYLEISCKIKLDGSYLIGDENNFGKLYVPFGADWQPGKRYVYTLIFGGGYDKDGNPILQPINFDPSVEDWVNVDDNTSTDKDIPLYQ